MAVSREDVVARWPKLLAIESTAEWTAALGDAAAMTPASVWGARADLATIHLAAHALFLAYPELALTGQVQSESVGGVSRSYAVAPPASGASEDYRRTLPGQSYLRLRASLGLGFSVT